MINKKMLNKKTLNNKTFNKVLIANRGEIAVRIIRTAKDLGFRTVAVFSDADRNAPHVTMADEAIFIGNAPAAESYLNSNKLIDAAKKCGANAIHPGYGFLSENSSFAHACELAEIIFIGPSADAIELMGSKRQAKIAMKNANVPCIPSYEGNIQSDDVLISHAINIGFPLMIKASAGGGGRGMRLVKDESELVDAIKSARSESLNAFGNDELIVEKALSDARHIEIQIFADSHGNTIHLAERDCSVQRRHQKVIEEAPSLAVSEELRAKMGEAAILAAKACNYVGAGTVEFLLDASGDFYFLEMNTRLQVEHPVTELVTGLDLVALQLNIANGEVLPISQQQLVIKGHAIEVRLYAEDPADNFMPQTGDVLLWQPALMDDATTEISIKPSKTSLRIDSGIVEGQTISSFYDPMLAKLIAFGDNREQARRRLIRLVQDSHLLGVRDNRAFLSEILSDQTFIEGKVTTNFIADKFADNASLVKQIVSHEDLLVASVLMTCTNFTRANVNQQTVHHKKTFHSASLGERLISLSCSNVVTKLTVSQLSNNQHLVSNADASWTESLEIIELSERQIRYSTQGVIKTRGFVFDTNPTSPSLWLTSEKGNLQFFDQTFLANKTQAGGSEQVLASMDGLVIEILVNPADSVKAGDIIAVIEAMKMEHQLKASVDGVVEKILVSANQQVKARQLMVQLNANTSTDNSADNNANISADKIARK